MNFKFSFEGTFNADGYAQGDKKVLESLNIRPHTTNDSTTFHLTQALPKLAKPSKVVKDTTHKQNPALTLEECKPDSNYKEGLCIALPSNVSTNSIFSNIISSFRHNFHSQMEKRVKQVKESFRLRKNVKRTRLYPQDPSEEDVDDRIIRELEKEEEKAIKDIEDDEKKARKKLDKKLEAWEEYLKFPQNKHVLSDAFWYMRYHIVSEPESEEITEFVLRRMAKNYIDLFLSVAGSYKESFFKNYFNILSQGVFYSFFYACPKSRDDLNDGMKEIILTQFSLLFAGIELADSKKYFSNWYLDLGAGNILKSDDFMEDIRGQLPPISFRETTQIKVLRTQQHLRYSPIILTYLGSENYQTRNVVKGYKMNFSKISSNKEEVEKKFEVYRQIAKKINQDLETFKIEDKKATKKLKSDLKKMREECWNHQRRLSRRRDEEIEKGAHEYANYLVSMLNAHATGGTQSKI